MSDRKAPFDANEPPEDVATLFSWANLHGAKYRDFSAARAQTREKARQRVQQVIEEERERARLQAEAQQPGAQRRTSDAPPAEEKAHLAALATELAAQLAAHQAAEQAAEDAVRNSGQVPSPRQQSYPQTAWHQSQPDTYTPPDQPQPPLYPSYPPANYAAPTASSPAPSYPPLREETAAPPGHEFRGSRESREVTSRPAWLSEKPEPLAPPPVPQGPDDTIQGSRERLTSRWFALKTLYDGNPPAPPSEPLPPPANARAPVLGVFSLAGGVGKTSLVATLGRALSSRGERVLLVDTAAFGLLPFFFGARDQRLGQLRTFSPPATSGDAPIQMITLDPESMGSVSNAQEVLTSEIVRHARGLSRIIIDLATASGATARCILKLSPLVLVPVIPDINSVVSVSSIDAFFEHNTGASGKLPYYVLNQFDSSLPLNLDVREVLREQLGDRLLPFALRRSPVVSEALAEGMTVMDYAPNSTVAEDFANLVGWVKSLSAPASAGFRGVRWSER